ncbi:hypothetical protein [Microbacterium sp. BK668]|uniref:hypothetical protein n=1 Tax=Microbacterium sp. BK668 TaxID=2512118 RepID=UPI00105DDD10|nr:hypothetical protein [Microbacterium sp. BK668]TDN90901.1 hypothetical protein EV279_0394 [Microbacterium sp. BK668]
MLALPISGVQATWRPATGRDDIALADGAQGLEGAVDYVGSAVRLDPPVEARDLPVGDVDLVVVWDRRERRGDTMVAEGRCGRCLEPVDVRFSLAAYAAHHRPRASRRAEPIGDGWFRLRAGEAEFRVPTSADVLEAAASVDPRSELLDRCVRGTVPPATARSIEAAMARLAPTLRAAVAGTCPECGAAFELEVDARELCMAELRQDAITVYDDVNLIATAYGWSQDDILDLPSARRRRYAGTIAGHLPETRARELAHA